VTLDPAPREPESTSAVAAARRPSPIAHAARFVARVVLDWLPLVIVLFAYDTIHNQLGRWLPAAHTFPQIRFDQALFHGSVLTLVLQRAFYDPQRAHLWDYAALLVYTSHFVASIAVALVLRLRSRARFLRFTWLFAGMTSAGYVTYVLFPAVPPWLASQHGDLATTHRVVRELWDGLGWHGMASLFSGSSVYANDVAAIPSLHAAYPLLFTLFFWRTSGVMVRAGLMLYTVAMAVVLVYSAEHYTLDIVLGWLFAVAAIAVMRRFWPERAPARYA